MILLEVCLKMGLDDLEGIRGGSRVCGSDRSVVEKLIEVG